VKPIITVSRQMGAGAEHIIAGVSKRLDLAVVDRAVIGRSAVAAGVPAVAFQELTYEGQRTLVHRMLHIMQFLPGGVSSPRDQERDTIGPFTFPFGGAFGSPLPSASDTRATMDRYVDVIGMVIRDLSLQGGVLVVGQGGQAILRDEPLALHVQIISVFESRLQRLMERDGLQRNEALRRLQVSDDAREKYVRKYHGIDWLDPRHYHLTLNTSKMRIEGAIQTIVHAAEWQGKPDSSAPAG
jgi:cytidylate kinase